MVKVGSHLYWRQRQKDYLTGEVEKPDKTNPKYRHWKIENTMVKGWLLGSMKPKISDHYLILETATQIWDVLTKSYSELGHTAKVYELRQWISQFKQNGQPLVLYHTSLQKLWEELEHYHLSSDMCKGHYWVSEAYGKYSNIWVSSQSQLWVWTSLGSYSC